ncbi:MAG: tRNA pseudouridine(38-40) synthase TruA [Bdellovibrio sp.]
MARYKMVVAYDGTDFCGWQKQKDHQHGPELPSVQETIEKALEKIFQHPVNLSASGRTDAGVHAAAQVCHFETERKLPVDLCWAMKSLLPNSVSPKDVWLAPDSFHSTLSATKKTYQYWVWNHERTPALLARYSWWIRKPLDIDQLNLMADQLLGEQDFASFRSMGTDVKHTVRQILEARWTWRRQGLLQFEVTGNGFMKQMVRNMVGTQIDLVLKGQPPETIKEIISFQDRKKAGPAAPPQGLFLRKVYYPKSLDSQCRKL